MWQQIYDPFNNIILSALVAFLPILCFLISLVFLKLKGYQAAFLTLILSALIALFAYGMPLSLLGATFIQGFANGIWPIAWIIIAAIFLYKLSIKSGSFEIIKQSVMSITPDHRIQVILIGFCFGSFLEGAIGFGGPVAITAALLVGLGLKPLYAAGLCLIANTAPVAFGAVGIPIIAMSNLVGIEQHSVSAMVGRMLVPLSLSIPFFIVFLMDGIKGVKETFPAIFVATISFTATQFLSSNHLGAELPDIISAVVSLSITTIFLKFWKPKNIFRLDDVKDFDNPQKLEFKKVLLAWMPFILLIICIIIWTQPWFKALFAKDGILNFMQFSIKFNETLGSIVSPDIVNPQITKTMIPSHTIDLVAQAGTAILLAALMSIVVLKIKLNDASECFWETLKDMAIPCFTIGLVVAFAFIAKNSGMSTTLGLAFANTGDAYAFFSPIIGWIGVFLTGSDTSSNLLFGTLQQVSAQKLGVSEALFLAANSVGGVVGKMISPQSIAVACAAVGLVGRESELFRFTLKYSIAFVVLIGIWTFVIAFFLSGIIPDVITLK
ncbi:L-lactate permease [Campylobacter volucris]|uniref:L-lactate permease n=1 Tax=Campylobacter volucris TaxID=1031542 RepID=A0AAE5YGR1_9BACT|nr:L-lactate permease [Campylobacter volucris]AJC94736.1 L-lactate permease [Campylobacter volucris LMG 24379]KAB0579369.1 L-lactate permease [Campylobacter volucris]MBF7042693.1 L-lactate permease [Campylobacter volucris]QBL12921.1 L-lactate permease [Campylobacter volucris]QEL08953.1 L-lactate permease [Campylobacter volucris]